MEHKLQLVVKISEQSYHTNRTYLQGALFSHESFRRVYIDWSWGLDAEILERV